MSNLLIASLLSLALILHLAQSLGPHLQRQRTSSRYGLATVVIIQGLIALALFCALFESLYRNAPIQPILLISGVALLSIKVVLKRRAVRSLSGHYSLYIELHPSQKLVTTGPYAIVRHPCFLSTIMECTGVMLIAESWLTMLVFLPLIVGGYLFRISLEERFLTEHFPLAYAQYRDSVPALVPRLERLRQLVWPAVRSKPTSAAAATVIDPVRPWRTSATRRLNQMAARRTQAVITGIFSGLYR